MALESAKNDRKIAAFTLLKFRSKTGLDINQKVYIENAPVLGDGAGETSLNQCKDFAPQHVANVAAPSVRVCGTGVKLTAYFRRVEHYVVCECPFCRQFGQG